MDSQYTVIIIMLGSFTIDKLMRKYTEEETVGSSEMLHGNLSNLKQCLK